MKRTTKSRRHSTGAAKRRSLHGVVRAARTCKGCIHFYDRSNERGLQAGPNSCTHLDHCTTDCNNGRCKDYNPLGPVVHQHRSVGLEHVGIKALIGYMLNEFTHCAGSLVREMGQPVSRCYRNSAGTTRNGLCAMVSLLHRCYHLRL